MADLVKLKTGKIDKLASVDQDNNPVVPLEAGNVYFAVDTTTHKGKIVYDAPNGTSVDRIVMSTDAEKADSANKALTADKAVTLVAARNIDGINFNGGANVIHYTTCATNASKVEKIVTINGFALVSGARISVRFANTNSADNPTLNVSDTGAKPILYNGINIPTAYLTKDKVWDFIYDGDLDAWVFVGDKNIDTNTTYAEATATKSGLMSASDKTKLDTIQSGAKVVNYESHLASGVKIGTITIGGTATDIFSTPDTWTAFKGATADAAGSAGYISNAPAAGAQDAFFTGAGTWKALTVADDKNNGLMSSDDRTKLDSIESKANYTYLNASAPISVDKHVGTITISHDASGATAATYGTNSSTALTPGFGENFSVTGFQINATGHVTSASNHNVKMPDTLVDDTHRGLMSSDMYLAWNKGITLAGHQLLLGSAWSKADFLDTLGLTNALRWIGNATVAIADGSKTDPEITGYDFSKAKPGDVVLDKDNKREYAWTLAGTWESLGPDGDLATADHRHANATSTTDGFMSADDKAKLDTVESKANYIYVSANAPISVDKHVGALTITHNASGVTAGAYGDAVAQAPGFGASFLVPNLTVNATGHVTVAGAHTVTIPNALVTDKTNGLMSADDKARFDIIKDGYYVKRAGDTMTGDLLFSDVGTGVRQIRLAAGGSDFGRLAVSATDSDVGYVEIASADNGNEPIYVRQYTGIFETVKRTLTLLDGSGNTILPGTLTAAGATINGATTINSTLHTTGATTLDSTLSVGGTATMKGALNVNGAATIGSNLTVAGTSTLNGPLVTNGAVTFNNVAFNYAGMKADSFGTFRNVWFSEATHRGQPVYNDNFVYNPGTAQLWIKSTTGASNTTNTGALIIGADNGNQIAIDNNEILARNKSSASILYLQSNGGRILTKATIESQNETDATTTTSGSIETVGGVGIGKQLRVGGATNLGSSLTVASGTSIGGALSVSGNTTLNSNLSVTGDINLANNRLLSYVSNRTIDLSATTYDVNTYYPVVGSPIPRAVGHDGYYYLKCAVSLDSGTKPSWATHKYGFTCDLEVLNESCGYGVTYANCIILADDYNWTDKSPVGYTQMGNSSYPIFWLRGGGKYVLTTSYKCEWSVKTASFTSNNESVAPSSSRHLSSFRTLYLLQNGNTIFPGVVSSTDGTDSTAVDNGSIHTNGGLGVAKQARIGGGLTVGGFANISGSLSVGAAATLASTLTVNNSATIYGTTSLGNTLYMNGQTINLGGAGANNLIRATGTDAANGYGGAYNNIVIESWYGFSIGTTCSNFPYTGKNAFSVNARDGETYVGGSLYANNNVSADHGYLKSTNYGNTVTIGSQNTSYMHFTNSANIPFWFNRDVRVMGNLYGGGGYNQRLPMNDGDWGMTFHWSGQGGQPTWLWGGNNSSDMYVYNPSNFHVKEADALVYTGGRITSANISHGDGRLYYYMATSSMTTGKPPWDAHILHLSWDNTGGWDSQIAQTDGGLDGRIAVRAQNAGTWSAWKQLAFLDETSKLYHQEKTIAVADWTNSALTTNGITYPYCYSFNATGVTADETIAWLEITSGQQVGDMVISTGAAKISVYTTVKPSAALGIKAWYIGKGTEGSATITQYEQLAQRVENATKSAMLFSAGASAPSDTSGRTAWLDTTNKRLKFYWDGAWRAVNTYQ